MTATIPQWAENLVNEKYPSSMKVVSSNTLPSPPGYAKSVSKGKTAETSTVDKNKEHINSLQVQKAWQIALQPAKSIPMNFFMSYMSGTSLQIIPLMTALMLLSGPLKSTFAIRSTFKGLLLNDDIRGQVLLAMFMYIVFQAALMAIGLQKLNSMGLLPNTKSDWLAWELPMAYNIRSYAF